MIIFWIFNFLLLIILLENCQKIFAFTYTSKDGVKLSYDFKFKRTCRGERDRIGILPGIAFPECVKECGMRQHCKALNYKRRYNTCHLYSVEENTEDRNKESCVEVKASDIEIQERLCDDCSTDKTCDPREKTCKYTECLNNESPLNGKIIGNMNGVSDRIQYKCDFGYEVAAELEYAVCLPDGNWSVVVDNCTKRIETNVALGKETAMSSVYGGYDGTNGVDGNTIQYFTEGSCFHTNLETNPWWRVDLGAIYGIVRVTIYNRMGNECEHVECNLRATDLRLSAGTKLTSMHIYFTVQGPLDDKYTSNFPEDTEARYVQVTLEGHYKVLHLCEVQVFGFPI